MNGDLNNLTELAAAGAAASGRRRLLRLPKVVTVGRYAVDAAALALLGSLAVHAAAGIGVVLWLVAGDSPKIAVHGSDTPSQPVNVRLLDAAAMAQMFADQRETEPRIQTVTSPMADVQPVEQDALDRPVPSARASNPSAPADAERSTVQPRTLAPTLKSPREQPVEPTPLPPTPVAVEPEVVVTAPLPTPPTTSASVGQTTGVRIVQLPSPRYPAAARRAGEQGLVLLEVEVRADGSAGQVRVVKSPGHRRLVDAAIEAVKRARFKPATRDRQPIAQRVRIPYRFVLE